MNELLNKKVLITGGTSGIGRAIAELFSSYAGATVIIVGRSEEKGKQIVKNNKNVFFEKCDVTNEEEIIDLRSRVINKYNEIDVLINNAGVLLTDPVENIKLDDWNTTFATNTTSTMLMTKHFIDTLQKTKGCILNNASIDGLQSCNRGRASYSYGSSKAAVIHFTQLCALNYADKGVRINCLCPGVTETPFFTNRDFSRFISSIPMGRVAQPIEIAKAALFLVSPDSSYITGTVLTVDGGASLK